MGLRVSLIVLLTAVLYSPLMHAPFHYEDDNWRTSLTTQTDFRIPSRFLTVQTYRWTPTPSRAYAVNVAVHLASAGVIFLIGSRVLTPTTSAFGTALFLLHPLNSEAVSYLTARTDLLMTLFTLLACWLALAWVDRGGWWRVALMGLSVLCAALSKELGLMAGPLVLLTVLVWRDGARVRWLCRVAAVAGCAALWVARADLTNWLTMGSASGGAIWAWPDFVAVQCAALWGLLGRVLVPYGQTIDHDWLSTPPAFTAAAVVATLLLAVIGFWAWFGRARMLAFAIGWLALTVGPRLVIGNSEFLNEGDIYSAMPALCLLLSAALAYRWQTVPTEVCA